MNREGWVEVARRLAEPVLTALAARRLRATMPTDVGRPGRADRSAFQHLEAFGRLLAGIGPWLELDGLGGEEAAAQGRLREAARAGLDAATDPASPDCMNFDRGRQPVVDAAFLAQGLLRAPRRLWAALDERVKRNVAAAMRATRAIEPHRNNWLLFAATIEAFLHTVGEPIDAARVGEALDEHERWYKGDGHYGDGPELHCDYYNSFVIHPMLVDVLAAAGHLEPAWRAMGEREAWRARRYAAVVERMISPEGTFPPIGRSLCYRCGVLHALAQSALGHDLPAGVSPAQARCAMGAVIARTLNAPHTFDASGWLRVGFVGHQPGMAEDYISAGSPYLCSVALLPLGLSPGDPFWADADEPWTARRAWAGEDIGLDRALKGV